MIIKIFSLRQYQGKHLQAWCAWIRLVFLFESGWKFTEILTILLSRMVPNWIRSRQALILWIIYYKRFTLFRKNLITSCLKILLTVNRTKGALNNYIFTVHSESAETHALFYDFIIFEGNVQTRWFYNSASYFLKTIFITYYFFTYFYHKYYRHQKVYIS